MVQRRRKARFRERISRGGDGVDWEEAWEVNWATGAATTRVMMEITSEASMREYHSSARREERRRVA